MRHGRLYLINGDDYRTRVYRGVGIKARPYRSYPAKMFLGFRLGPNKQNSLLEGNRSRDLQPVPGYHTLYSIH
jgi:hypothetical protein